MILIFLLVNVRDVPKGGGLKSFWRLCTVKQSGPQILKLTRYLRLTQHPRRFNKVGGNVDVMSASLLR